YWARVAGGQKLKRRPLSPLKEGQSAEVHVRRWRAMASKADAEKPQAGEVGPIKVSSTLEEPHELVALSASALRKARAGDDGIARCRERRCLAIEVAPTSVERALRIMDALLKALDANGHKVQVREPAEVYVWTPSVTRRQVRMPITLVLVDGESVPFALEEI